MEDAPPRPVLVVDDEESLRHALRRGLGRAGFDPTEAATGREAVDLFAAGGFHAVLTDLRLPDLGGLDLVAIFTEMDAEVPVVVMTGYGSVETAMEAMRRGAVDYVQKPFEVLEVVHVLERALQERNLTQENRRLRALVERRFSDGDFTQVERELAAHRSSEDRDEAPADGPLPLRDAQRRFEVHYVEELLVRTGGNIAAAARLAGISRPNFHKKLNTLGVDAARFKRAAGRGRVEG